MTGNVLDYMEWRGDLSFSVSPFNDVDNLILAMLSYVDLDDIVPAPEERTSITVLEAARQFFSTHSEAELRANKSLIADTYKILGRMAKTKRFSSARLSNFVNRCDRETEMQFAALHIALDDGTTYISFRGTDDSLVGWKEDFNMAYQLPVPSQTESKKYLEETIRWGVSKYRLGGHSKGGNLAIYSAIFCKESYQKRIINIYNNDGPGFLKSLVHDPKYQKMKSKIKTIVPESSIIGMLLEHDNEDLVVKSRQVGAKQHDGMTWEVQGAEFVAVNQRSQESMIVDKALTDWLNELEDEKRYVFIDTVFQLLLSTGANNLSELNSDSMKKMNVFVKNLSGLDKDTRSMVFHLASSLTLKYSRTVREFKEQKKKNL